VISVNTKLGLFDDQMRAELISSVTFPKNLCHPCILNINSSLKEHFETNGQLDFTLFVH